MNDLVTLISNVGFPIAVCVYMIYANDKLRAALEENTKVIALMKEKLEQLISREE